MIKFYDITEEGGGGGGPVAPKGYAVTTPAQRSDWNSFLDYAGKANVDFDKNPAAAATLMAQYKKTNPNFSLTPNDIQRIQYEQYQLRKGDKFGNLSPEQMKYLRQGLPDAYLNRPIPDATGQFNTATSKLYYPQKTVGDKSYGTDIEGYVNSLNGQPTAAKVQKVAAPINTQPKNTTPATGLPPVYASHDTALKRATQLAQMPGNEFLHNRADALINANYVPLNDTQSFRESALQAAKGAGIDPATFWASAAEEGATGLIPDKQGNLNTDEKIDLGGKYPVSGFANFGLDNFHDQFKELVKKGYLPKDLDYEKTTRTNELGQTVHSGNFKTVADAMKAKAAYVRMEQDRIDDYAKKNNIPLSDKARQFFTLINYNGGAGDEKHKGAGVKMMDYYAKKGLLKDDKFLDVRPESGLGLTEYYDHIHPRMQVGDLLKKEKIFE